MLSNHLKTATRFFWNHKLYAVINVTGLAVGITCIILAVLFYRDERSYDQFHTKKDNLYRIITSVVDDKSGNRSWKGGTGQVQGPAFKDAVPEIKEYVRLLGGDIAGDIMANGKVLNLKMLFSDPGFFRFFSFDLLHGNPNKALENIDAIVVTESVARKYFNRTDVVGEAMNLDADPSASKLGKPMVITGVVKDPPLNSSIQFDVLLTMKFIQLSFTDDAWLNQYLGTFVLLNPDADIKKVASKFDQVFAVHAKQQVSESVRNYGYDPKIYYSLQRITDIHLNPMPTNIGWREGGIVNEGNPVYSWLFIGIACFILAMAAINFINITIANSIKRAKEVGVRKITGGTRGQILFQFLLESALLCICSFLLAIVLTQILLPVFNQLAGKQIGLLTALDPSLIGALSVILLLIILFTGIYPSWLLAAVNPAEVLYSRSVSTGRGRLGRLLVVVQFSLAVFFLISSIIYYRQMEFIRERDLGYSPHNILITNVKGNRQLKPVYNSFRQELKQYPSIEHISYGGGDGMYLEAVKVAGKEVNSIHKIIDEEYLPLMDIPLLAGRNFSPRFSTDTADAVIVNEAFVRAAGLIDPIGKRINVHPNYQKEPKTIIGVIRDYHLNSLRFRIEPMVLFMSTWYGGGILVKFRPENREYSIAAIEKAYKKIMPEVVYQYNLLDDMIARDYEKDARWQTIISVATIVSIVICCLGLFGLAHLSAQKRAREIGIRKVLGATVISITQLLSFDFLKLVFISILIASPAGWFFMNRWLEDFAYRMNISWTIFFIAAAFALFIALLTVSTQAIKAAMVNPVKSLKVEG